MESDDGHSNANTGAAVGTVVVLVGILLNNSRLGDTNARITELRSHMDNKFAHVDNRFDDMPDMWRTELRRMEEVFDAHLKHLEER